MKALMIGGPKNGQKSILTGAPQVDTLVFVCGKDENGLLVEEKYHLVFSDYHKDHGIFIHNSIDHEIMSQVLRAIIDGYES